MGDSMSWMHRILGADGTSQAKVGATTGALRTMNTPLEYGSLGHYRVNHRCVLVANQAANSRIFEVRNSGTSLLIPTRLAIKWVSSSAHTAIIEDSLDVYKVTGFTVVDTTNTVTLTGSVKRTTGMTATASAGAVLRGLTIAGNANGMTGGTLTKDSSSVGQVPMILAQAVMAATDTASRYPQIGDIFDDVNGTHPFVFAQNEGLIVENRVLLGAAAGSSVYIDFSWAEVPSF